MGSRVREAPRHPCRGPSGRHLQGRMRGPLRGLFYEPLKSAKGRAPAEVSLAVSLDGFSGRCMQTAPLDGPLDGPFERTFWVAPLDGPSMVLD
jgi:hypothetical protein